jgi:hypothetical protein
MGAINPNQAMSEVFRIKTATLDKGLCQGRRLEGVVGILAGSDVVNPASHHLRYSEWSRGKTFQGRAQSITDCKPDKRSNRPHLVHIKRSPTNYIYPRTVVFFEEW